MADLKNNNKEKVKQIKLHKNRGGRSIQIFSNTTL